MIFTTHTLAKIFSLYPCMEVYGQKISRTCITLCYNQSQQTTVIDFIACALVFPYLIGFSQHNTISFQKYLWFLWLSDFWVLQAMFHSFFVLLFILFKKVFIEDANITQIVLQSGPQFIKYICKGNIKANKEKRKKGKNINS